MDHNLGPARERFLAPEFVLVVLIAFGLFSAAGAWMLFGAMPERAAHLFDADHRWTLLVYQAGVAPVLAYILWQGGWKWSDFAVRPSPRGLFQGLGLGAVAYALFGTAALIAPASAAAPPVALSAIPGLALGGLLGASVVKAAFTEIIACGYVVQSLRGRFGIAVAVNASIALRLSFNLHEGPAAFLQFAALGLLFTLFYVKSGRLWPIIVAHALFETLRLAVRG